MLGIVLHAREVDHHAGLVADGAGVMSKALNTINHLVMVDPGRVSGEGDVFVCGDDEDAKAQVHGLLRGLGWADEAIVDLGATSPPPVRPRLTSCSGCA